MNKKKLYTVSALVGIVIIISTWLLVKFFAVDNKITIFDNQGNVLATAKDAYGKKVVYSSNQYKAYVDIVLDEMQAIGGKQFSIGKIAVNTNFDKNTFDACLIAHDKMKFKHDTPFAISVLDINGTILCAYNDGYDCEETNYVTKKMQAYSAFKPLSVYAPGIENGAFTCSTTYEDSPYKKIENEAGVYVDWPTNGNEKYLHREVTVSDGISKSLNTVAVKALLDLGVKNSISFLTKSFDIDLSLEKQDVMKNGEESVLSSIGLGYLRTGVSPIDMSGYYEVFANEGKYIKPHSIDKIEKNGKEIYKYELKEDDVKQVISPETAFIMNWLLQNTLNYGGTASGARKVDLPIGGKTGTGSNYAGNWFVGFTPEYVCTVWHGDTGTKENYSAKTFGIMLSNMEYDSSKKFRRNFNVVQKDYMSFYGRTVGYYLPK